MTDFKNVIIPKSVLVEHNLALIRNKESTREVFLSAFKRLSYFLLSEALSVLPQKTVQVETPIESLETKMVDDSYSYLFVPILRAGLALTETAVELLPQAHVVHIGMYRDENTHQPVWYYDKTPAKFKEKTKVFILDPMLATGGSALATIGLFVKKGVSIQDIVFVSVLSAPEGIELIHSHYPDLKIITSSVDKYLNNNAYIVPGLGDAGDRFFNSVIY